MATTDAGLVGNDNDRPAQLVSPKAGQFENSGNELELVRPMDVPTVNIDHAVTVKKKCTVMHGCANYTTDSCCVLDSRAAGAAVDIAIAALLKPTAP
jgi:hypothetical protein